MGSYNNRSGIRRSANNRFLCRQNTARGFRSDRNGRHSLVLPGKAARKGD